MRDQGSGEPRPAGRAGDVVAALAAASAAPTRLQTAKAALTSHRSAVATARSPGDWCPKRDCTRLPPSQKSNHGVFLHRPAEAYVGEFVSGNYFTTFGIGAFAGRTILPTDDIPGAPPVVVMSYRAWRQRFGSDPSVIGATLIMNTIPYVVSGIAPPEFFGDTLRSDPPDFWLPLATAGP